MDSFFPQSTPQSYVLLLLSPGAYTSLFSAVVSVIHRAAYQLTLLVPPGLLFYGASALCLLALPHCATACCPLAHSPPPLATSLPLVTPLPRVAPLLFSWLLHFPDPQPLHLVAPLHVALVSDIHHTSTFCRAPLVWLVVEFPCGTSCLLFVIVLGSVRPCSCSCIHSVQQLLPQSVSRASPNITFSIVVAARVRRQRGASPAIAISVGALVPVWCQLVASPAIACAVGPLPGHGTKEGE